MLNYDKLSRKPSIFRSFTGLKVPEFDAAYIKIYEKYPEYEEKRLYREDRQRIIGSGYPISLDLRHRLLMLLTYQRLYVTHTLLGFLVDVGQSNVPIKHMRTPLKPPHLLPKHVPGRGAAFFLLPLEGLHLLKVP